MTVAVASIRQLEESKAELQAEIEKLSKPLSGTSAEAVIAEAKRQAEARNAIPALRAQIEYISDEIARLEKAEQERQREASELASVRRLAEARARIENRAKRFQELIAEAEQELRAMQAIADEVSRDGQVFTLAPSVANVGWAKLGCCYLPSVEADGDSFKLLYRRERLFK